MDRVGPPDPIEDRDEEDPPSSLLETEVNVLSGSISILDNYNWMFDSINLVCRSFW